MSTLEDSPFSAFLSYSKVTHANLERSAADAVGIAGGQEVSSNLPREKDWPQAMDESAFYGLAGDFVRLVLPQTEADQQALLVAFLVGFGCMVGRSPFYQVEDTRHGMNEFAVIVGETSKSRKGTATDRATAILARVDEVFIASRRRSGLSSGEGLIQAVRDAREEDVPVKDRNAPQRFERQVVDTGEPDKRLFVIESEFASVLQQSGRDGNILSAVLRDSWGGKALRVLARSNKDSCQEPHISVLGNITCEELQRLVSTSDKANGFGTAFSGATRGDRRNCHSAGDPWTRRSSKPSCLLCNQPAISQQMQESSSSTQKPRGRGNLHTKFFLRGQVASSAV